MTTDGVSLQTERLSLPEVLPACEEGETVGALKGNCSLSYLMMCLLAQNHYLRPTGRRHTEVSV